MFLRRGRRPPIRLAHRIRLSQLTEYEDYEVIGRNCRFLQSPDGNVHNGEERQYVAPKTVQHLYKAVVSDKECQANYGAGAPAVPSLPAPPPRECRAIISKDLQALLSDPTFVNSLPISTSTISPTFENTHDKSQLLNLILLESFPDFIHVLSHKGFFLYVAPSIRNVLGFEVDELVRKLIAEYCHPADLVPLMHELKESSVPDTVMGLRRTVDLLFCIHSRSGGGTYGLNHVGGFLSSQGKRLY